MTGQAITPSFAAQPPEIISGQMYSGPGAAPLLGAASAWTGLAAELHAGAASFAAIVSGLDAGWQGPAAESMAAAAARYRTWLSTTAVQAEETASRARAAASAYESAFAGVVPPPVIAANRSALAALVASNILGQNSAAIAATEAQYGQMWAQDVAAMVGYATTAQAATQLTAFTAPAPATTDNGQAAQLTQTLATSPTQYTEAVRGALNSITGDSTVSDLYESLWDFQSTVGSEGTWTNAVGGTTSLGMTQVRLFHKLPGLPVVPKTALSGGLASLGLTAPPAALGAATASTGSAATVGALSVPPSWAGAHPAIRLAAAALPATAAAPAADLGSLLSPAALGSMTGGALGGPAGRGATAGVKVVATNTENRAAPVKLEQVIAQLQQTPDVVQHWNVDEAGLDDLVAKLSLKPGIHAVHVCADGETPHAGGQAALG